MLTNANIYIDGETISQVSTMKYLVIDIDSKPNWNNHIDRLCRTILPKIGLLRRLRQIVPTACLTKYYMATVQSHIDYCLTVWGFTSNKNLNRLQKFQNRAARIITNNLNWDIRGVNIVKDLGWLNIKQRRDYFVGLLVFKSLNNLLPDYIIDKFTMTCKIARRSTTPTPDNKLFLPKANKAIYASSLEYSRPLVWNQLPSSIRELDSMYSFKKNFSKYLLTQMAP